MISGVIGLLYSLPCDHFSKIVTDSPAQATLQLKNLIIKSAVKHPSYENITTTEGYFDAREASRYFSTLCEGQLMVPSSKGRLSFKNLEFHSNSISFDFATPYRGDHIIQLINYDGKILFEQKMLPVDFGVNLISVPFNIEIHIPLILSISSKFERINYHFRKY
jgi:hypothetical protein